jgi:molybdopterin-guanine dinucleotide biosynthesis protein
MAHKANWVSKDGQPAKSKVSRLCHTLHGHKMLTKVRDHYRITQAGRKEIGFDDE